MKPLDCPLCHMDASTPLFTHTDWLVIDAQDPVFPGLTRIIWREHVNEMSDLTRGEREILMAVVFEVESVMRAQLKPDKVNVASLGNQVPHLHWHVIARWQDDASFPGSIWTASDKPATDQTQAFKRRQAVSSCLPEYHRVLINHLHRVFS